MKNFLFIIFVAVMECCRLELQVFHMRTIYAYVVMKVGAELIGKGHLYPVPYFTKGEKASTFLAELNKRARQIFKEVK